MSRPSFDSGRTAYPEQQMQQPQLAGPAPENGAVAISMMNSVIGAQKIAVPRAMTKVKAKIAEAAAMGGKDFIYRWEVNNRAQNRKDLVEGPTIKCAQAVAIAYGNCAIDTRVEYAPGEGGWWIYARFSDYETGYQVTRPFFQSNRNMMKMKDDQRAMEMVISIGISKATRNVIVNALGPYVEFAMEEADRALVEWVKQNEDRARAWINKVCTTYNLSLLQAAKFVGRPFERMTHADLAVLLTQLKGVEEGTIDADTLWIDNLPVEPETAKGSGEPAKEQVKEPATAATGSDTPAAQTGGEKPPADPNAAPAAPPKPPAKPKAPKAAAAAPPPPAQEPAATEKGAPASAAAPTLDFNE